MALQQRAELVDADGQDIGSIGIGLVQEPGGDGIVDGNP